MRLFAGNIVSNAVSNTYKQVKRQESQTVKRFFYWGFVFSILLTMVASPLLNLISSFAAVFFLVSLLVVSSIHFKSPVILGMLAVSLISGCSGPILDDRAQANRDICTEITGKVCAEYTIEGIYIFGIPTKDISKRAAVIEGKLNTVNVSDQVRGYGLIGLARVTVLGS